MKRRNQSFLYISDDIEANSKDSVFHVYNKYDMCHVDKVLKDGDYFYESDLVPYQSVIKKFLKEKKK